MDENENIRLGQQTLSDLPGESEDILRAISSGEVDAFIVRDSSGERVYTLHGADQVYQILLAQMREGALTLLTDGTIVYCGPALAGLLGTDSRQLIGRLFQDYVTDDQRSSMIDFLAHSSTGQLKQEFQLINAGGQRLPVFLSATPFQLDSQDQALCVLVTDLTEQRIYERLSESEQRYRLAVRATNDAIWDWDLKAEKITWNGAFHHLFGYSPTIKETSPKWRLDCVHPDDRSRVATGFSDTLDNRHERWETEYRFRRGDGEYVIVNDRAHILYSEAGQPLRMIGALADVNVSKRQALQQAAVAWLSQRALNESDLQNLFDVAVEKISASLTVSHGVVFQLSTRRDELLLCAGTGWHDGLSGQATVSAAQDSPIGCTLAAAGPVVINDLANEAGRFRETQLLQDHHIVSGLSCVIADSDGTAYGVLGAYSSVKQIFSVEDLNFLQAVASTLGSAVARQRGERALQASERQARQQLAELEAIYSAAPVGLCVLNQDLRFIRVNERMAEIDGVSVAGHYGKTLFEIAPDLAVAAQPALQRVLHDGKAVLNIKTTGQTFVQMDSKRHWVQSLLPLRNGGGEVIGINLMVEDTTERVNAESALSAAHAAAEAASQAKSEFLANMSHEIRTPMSAILGYADLLMHRLEDPDDRQCVETIRRNGQHLIELINDILDVSKIEAGRLDIIRERFAPDMLIAEVRSLMAVRARERNLTLDVVFPDKLPATIESDRTRLKQILINLIGNAIKFTDEGGVELRVSLLRENQNAKLQFDVIDTGIGISHEQQARLFQPFTQADSSLTRSHQGSGLGLAISQRLAALLGGTITLVSEPGQGSTFSVTIAAGSLHNTTLVTAQLDGLDAPSTDIMTSVPRLNKRILVVDDRRDIRYLIAHALEEAGAEVSTAGNGAAALAAVEEAQQAQKPFAAIVLDMQMPVMDGYAAARKLRESHYRGPILALTAHAMKGDRERCMEAGCSDYLAKPVNGHELVMKINTHLAGPAGATRKTMQSSSSARRVLVVEDGEDARTALQTLLELAGHEVQVAANAATALALVQNFKPEVALLDLSLPDMDGYRLAQQLRSINELQKTVLIALSGQAADSGLLQAAGFDHHLQKPAEFAELLALFPND